MSSQQDLHAFEYADLSPAEADVLRRIDDGRSITDVAADTHRARSTVRTLLHRARRKRGEAPNV